MKQHITVEQLRELSDKGKRKLKNWFKKTYGYDLVEEITGQPGKESCIICGLPYYTLSIGQMIEYLMETNNYFSDSYIDDSFEHTISTVNYGELELGWRGELCDKLWELVKNDLEK